MPSTATNEYPEEHFDKRRKLDEDAEESPRNAPLEPPTPQNAVPGGPPPPHDNRYHYDMYGMPMPPHRYPYDHPHDGYREPPSMPYSRGHPSPKGHPGYAYPPPPKDYYNSYHEYPPPGWGPPHGHYGHPKGHQPYSPRYSQHPYEYDRHYDNARPPKPSPTAENSYQSPTSVVNALDTRSPEGSRNLNNFEERVGGAPPPGPPGAPPGPPGPPGQAYHGGHYYPPIHSPSASHHPPSHPPHGPHGHPSRQWWSCDYCSYKFSTWEECSAHESMCPTRSTKKRPADALTGHNAMPHGAPHGAPHNAAAMAHGGGEESRFLDPREEYAHNTDRPTFSLSQPTDGQSLSDRQCYVRSHFVELFVATESDVSARHSRGAQKLHLNQVGLRCAYCAKLKPRDRAERAVCYPSSISRIYQTVADMQRFHFEACTAIPPRVLRVYKSLKTTRPRGVGSPQSYWDKSAREMGLDDSEFGICLRDGGVGLFGAQNAGEQHCEERQEHEQVDMASAVPLPSLMNNGEYGQDEPQGPWVNNEALSPRQQGHEEGQDKAASGSQAPCEADASILLMLKNPEASSPKSVDENANVGHEDGVVCKIESDNHAEV